MAFLVPGDFDCQEGIFSASLRAALCSAPTIATRRVRFPAMMIVRLVMALIAPNFIRELDPNAASSGR